MLYTNIKLSVPMTNSPSMSASARPEVIALWITVMESKREAMLPCVLFSKKSSGSRIKCAKVLLVHCRLMSAPIAVTAELRKYASAALTTTTPRNPAAMIASNSVSRPTIAWSRVH